jgi:hypothetical protein
MNILSRLLGRTENKTVSNNLTVVWGLPDPYLSDYNDVINEIHKLSEMNNSFVINSRLETYEKLDSEIVGAVLGLPTKLSSGLVSFVVARNARELDVAQKRI